MTMLNKRDVIILGGGAGGLTAASVLSQLGLKVTLIEKNKTLGGDCLHYGCVPSKALLHQAKIQHVLKQSYAHNVEQQPQLFQQAMQAVHAAIAKIQQHDDPKRFESYGCEVLFGHGEFVEKKQVVVNGQVYYGKKIIIATGSSPTLPPISGLKSCDYLTNETIFSLEKMPQSLLIIGAGVIGIEMAQAFVRLGVEVSVLDISDEVLPMLDIDAAKTLRTTLEKEGVKFYLKANINKVYHLDDYICLDLACANKSKTLKAEKLLVATGRASNCHNLALEKTNVKYTKQGIVVNANLQTSQKHIYAIGDVIAEPLKFTHLAEYHASLVISQIAFKWKQKVNYKALPSVIYTQPECAMVGTISETDKIKITTFAMSEIDRAITDQHLMGFCKVFTMKDKVVGAVIVGAHAGELISEWTLAINQKLTVKSIAQTIHAYPTLAQINKRVAGRYYAPALFNKKTKFIVKCLNILSR
ncbi:MAG: pyridine nucleotide-disulfide oxidoreductase [Legionellales bacterium]|nr:pyridine nucleotide-disulfide oxidoreductase [Legionellales bacterium]|tara:strand:- start:238 stop:1650 length:1413 start_codon:yes stop_codon:yes gene_type:complete